MTTTVSKGSKASPWWGTLVQGIFALIIGILILANPAATTVVIVQFLGIYWLVAGIFSIVNVFIDSSMWGFKLLMGILGVIAGLSVLQHPLWSSILLPAVLVIFIGIEGVVMGIISLITAFTGGGWGAGILGAVSILFGALLLGSPLMASLALPWVYGVLAVVGGIAAIIVSFLYRNVQPAQ